MPVREEFVQISRATALWLFSLGRRLIREGTGNRLWDPRHVEYLSDQTDPGLFETIPHTDPRFEWYTEVVHLLRALVAIAAAQLGDALPDVGPAHLYHHPLGTFDIDDDDSLSNTFDEI